MGQKKSEFDKVFSAWDILVIAFGAMIGWGWVVSSGTWIDAGGVVGAALAFAIGGVMIFFVGLTYAELTAAMPQCGGEHVFSYKAMGATGSFICTWAIVLGYVGVTCFEACAFPTIITYLWPGFLKGYLYTVAGFDIYASWLIVAIIVAFFIMMINILGAKTAAVLQTVLTCVKVLQLTDSGMEFFCLQKTKNSSSFRKTLHTDLLCFLIPQSLHTNAQIFIIRTMRAVLRTMTRTSVWNGRFRKAWN